LAFHPGNLPHSLQVLFNNRLLPWETVIEEAFRLGITDTNVLADIVFYHQHMDLIGTPLNKSMPNYQALAKEWTTWHQTVKSIMPDYGNPASGPASGKKNGVWKPYADSSLPESGIPGAPAKSWMSEAPTHEREVGIFRSTRRDGGNTLRYYVWKTRDPRMTCRDHNVHRDEAFHTWLELETSLSALRSKHHLHKDVFTILGNDCGTKGIAAMNLLVNQLMFIYAFKRGMCLRRAENTAWRKAREDGKVALEYAAGVIGAAGGAKPGASGGIPAKPHTAPHKISELDWKGFVSELKKLHDGKPASAGTSVSDKASSRADKVVRNGAGDLVGAIRYFD